MFLPQCERLSFIPTQTTGKIIVLYNLIFIFLYSKLDDKIFCTEWQQAFPDFSLLLISSWTEIWCGTVVPKYLNCSTLSKELTPVSNFLTFFFFASKMKYVSLYSFLEAEHKNGHEKSWLSTISKKNELLYMPYILYPWCNVWLACTD